jgi:hypothetical protein
MPDTDPVQTDPVQTDPVQTDPVQFVPGGTRPVACRRRGSAFLSSARARA